MPREGQDLKQLLERRNRLLAPTYRLFYDEPVHVVRAEGVWMYDAQGGAYLDAYNNVPVVGHCHPKVVERLVAQAARLNTHTRYLTEEPLILAERLLETLPPAVNKVTFTCTGSDANDLAIRVSRAVTGGTGCIVTDCAYHGTTEALAGMSPSTGIPPGPGVYVVESPVVAGGEQFASRVRACLERMRADDVRPAALLVDTIFSSDGVAAHPEGFLRAAVDEIRSAGGVFIADEVQPGFGRTGDGMWGFARHGVAPDIVTMGKPMGNGHPVAAMIARGDIMSEYAKGARYFNTFGGNNVSCAAALAVLDVIRDEDLIRNARQTGGYLHRGLQSIADGGTVLGEIRGSGLFFGVDVAANPATRLDPRKETARIVNGMRRERVLIGSAGRNASVLKIRPPLTFGQKEADFLLERLRRVLAN